MGKGSKRRDEDTGQINDNWDNIDWGKGRPKKDKDKDKPKQRDLTDIYFNDKFL
tara:strand:+ start:126 stop:287 length:162 start_codon:yes stop_codon:yes gene_type:complete